MKTTLYAIIALYSVHTINFTYPSSTYPLVHDDGYLLYDDGQGGTIIVDPNEQLIPEEIATNLYELVGHMLNLIFIPIIQQKPKPDANPEDISAAVENAMALEFGSLMHNVINIMIAASKEDEQKLKKLQPLLCIFALKSFESFKQKHHLVQDE